MVFDDGRMAKVMVARVVILGAMVVRDGVFAFSLTGMRRATDHLGYERIQLGHLQILRYDGDGGGGGYGVTIVTMAYSKERSRKT